MKPTQPNLQNPAMRPTRFADYTGQGATVKRLAVAVQSAKRRQATLEHTLLHGPPGVGKTSLAFTIAHEMGVPIECSNGPSLQEPEALIGILTRMAPGTVLFVDEIHRMLPAVGEYLYSAMEDFKIDVLIGAGHNAKLITMDVSPFTLIGATTKAGGLPQPLQNRFGIVERLELYTTDELKGILAANAAKLGLSCSGAVCRLVAARARGTPRVANRLLRRVRDWALVRYNTGRVGLEMAEAALRAHGIDGKGLDPVDRRYIAVLRDTYSGGPAGLVALGLAVGEDKDTLEDVVEPYLIAKGYVARTQRGRVLTPAGMDYPTDF